MRLSTRFARRSLAAAAVSVLGVGLALTAVAPASATTATDPNGRYTAPEIHSFLVDFYGEHGPDAYAREHLIDDYMKDQMAQGPGYDMPTCAQDTPQGIDVGEVHTAQSLGFGYATITTHWSGGETAELTAYVDLDGSKPMQLHMTDCGW